MKSLSFSFSSLNFASYCCKNSICIPCYFMMFKSNYSEPLDLFFDLLLFLSFDFSSGEWLHAEQLFPECLLTLFGEDLSGVKLFDAPPFSPVPLFPAATPLPLPLTKLPYYSCPLTTLSVDLELGPPPDLVDFFFCFDLGLLPVKESFILEAVGGCLKLNLVADVCV